MRTILIATCAFATLAIPGAAFAQDNDDDMRRGHGGPGGHGGRFMERIDTDKSGDISLEEFSQLGMVDLKQADADGNGELTVDEIVTAMEKRRAERRANRIKRMFDIDGDGKITVAEIESQREKRFALMDRDNSGAIEADEFRRGGRGFHRGKGFHGGMDGRGEGRGSGHHKKWRN